MLEAPPVDPMGEELAAAPTPAAATVTPHQAETKGEFTMLALTAIAESPWNPRKHFDAKELAELTASVALDGVWEPVLVRPHVSDHGVYELASGHRRFRAARAAGLTEIPALIRPLDDETFLKLLTIANLQRENVHPLEQADAFALQMKQFGWKPDRIARECGRGETFVYDHLKFLTLIDEVRELFFANRITTAHATELSRLKPSDQKRAIDVEENALWDGEHVSRDQMELDEASTDPYAGLKPRTVRELRAWVQDYTRFDAAVADPVLFPTATAVKAAVAAKLKVVSITWDRHIRDEAKSPDEKTLSPAHWRRADGQADSKRCEYSGTKLGVVVVGPDQGASFAICTAREKCHVHWGDEIKAKAKAAKSAPSTKSSAGKTPAAPREQAWERENRLREEARERFKAVRAPMVEACAAAIAKLPLKPGGALEQLILQGRRVDAAARKRFPRGKDPMGLLRQLAFQTIDDVNEYWAHERLPKLAKALGVDVAKLVKAHGSKPEPATKKGAR